jgi:hypothetical protein
VALLRPTSELVAVYWLKGLSGLGNLVATELPASASSWSASGFTQVSGVVGGTPSIDYALANPVVSLDFWANAPGSGRPPWNKANVLAEVARAGMLDHPAVPRLLVLPAAYNNARVITVFPLQEPRKVRDDDAEFARYTMDSRFSWVEVPK